MAGEKLTQIKVRNGTGTVTETIPISVSVNNIKYDDNVSLKEKIDSLKLDTKLNKNLGASKAGQFLIVGTNGNIQSTELNTAAIKQSLNIPTKLSKFENDVPYITAKVLKDDYSLETASQQANNTIDTMNNKIETLREDLANCRNSVNTNQTSNTNSFITLNQQINDIYSFMQNPQAYYNTRKNNQNMAVNTVAAKQIIDNTKDITSIKENIKKILGDNQASDQASQATSGRIGLLESNFAAFKKSIEDVNGVNKLGHMDFQNMPQIRFGDDAGVTSDIRIWGNADNLVGVSATNTINNKRYGVLARLETNASGQARSYKGLSIWNYNDNLWEYSTERFVPGETITLTNGSIFAGYVTTGGRDLKFFIPLNKSCRWCPMESFYVNWNRTTDDVLYIRGIKGLIGNQTGTYANYFNPKNTKNVNKKVNVLWYPKETGIELRFQSKDGTAFANATNETPITLHLPGHDIMITFGKRST